MSAHQEFYRRNLPHWQPPGCIIFITFNVAGALPEAVQKRLNDDSLRLKNDMTGDPVMLAIAWKKLFKYADENLDLSERCLYLKEPTVAQIVVDAIHTGVELQRFKLHRFCIMPNHVHLLIEPLVEDCASTVAAEPANWPPLFYTEEGRQLLLGERRPEVVVWYRAMEIMKGIKGFTARQINLWRKTSGAFWNRESYDHWVRNAEEYCRIVSYIDNNPVKAGLCGDASQWRWGSAFRP